MTEKRVETATGVVRRGQGSVMQDLLPSALIEGVAQSVANWIRHRSSVITDHGILTVVIPREELADEISRWQDASGARRGEDHA